jgi:hypothetical protein
MPEQKLPDGYKVITSETFVREQFEWMMDMDDLCAEDITMICKTIDKKLRGCVAITEIVYLKNKTWVIQGTRTLRKEEQWLRKTKD